jgi:hypothetical protein
MVSSKLLEPRFIGKYGGICRRTYSCSRGKNVEKVVNLFIELEIYKRGRNGRNEYYNCITENRFERFDFFV